MVIGLSVLRVRTTGPAMAKDEFMVGVTEEELQAFRSALAEADTAVDIVETQKARSNAGFLQSAVAQARSFGPARAELPAQQKGACN